MNFSNGPLRGGIGGPVGAGRTTLTDMRRRRGLEKIIEFLVGHGGLAPRPEPGAGKGFHDAIR